MLIYIFRALVRDCLTYIFLLVINCYLSILSENANFLMTHQLKDISNYLLIIIIVRYKLHNSTLILFLINCII